MTTGGEGKHAKGESGSASDKGPGAKAGAPRDRIVDASDEPSGAARFPGRHHLRHRP